MTDRYLAFVALLSQPDPADLPRRAHVWTQPGDEHRTESVMPGLLLRWLQHRLLAQTEEMPQPAKKAKRQRKQTITLLRRQA